MEKKNGGARKGAGRPIGATSPKRRLTEATIKKYAATGDMTPLEVMLMVMNKAVAQGNDLLSMQAAEAAAPYMHPKLQTTTLQGPGGDAVMVKIIDDIR